MDTFWTCLVCEKPVELNLDGEQSRCAECGSPRLKRIVPKPQKAIPIAFTTAHTLFSKMLEALNL